MCGSGAPERLDAAVAGKVDGLSRSGASRLIKDGLVTVGGRTSRRGSLRVECGAEVAVELLGGSVAGVSEEAASFSVAFEDDYVVVVDKPAGVAVHPGAGRAAGTLVDALTARRPEIMGVGDSVRPGLVHRLDKDTSGLIVFAKTGIAYSRLVGEIKARRVVRTYTALVAGRMPLSRGVIDAPVGRDPVRRTRQAVVSSGKPARTRYREVRFLSRASLLEVALETGRMHQIRVHMAAAGHPVIGDRTYGSNPGPPGLSRQFLHASRLEFEHPVTGECVDVSSPLPDDLRCALDHYVSA